MRWITAIAGLALIVALTAGCKQQCFLQECDFYQYHEPLVGLPPGLECDPSAGSQPEKRELVAPPPTVSHPERDIRYLSLAEAISIALEQGTVNGNSASQGTVNESLGTFNQTNGVGRFTASADSIRVLALDPGITATTIESSLSKFDARFTSSITWTTTDTPVGTAQTGFQTIGSQQRALDNQAAAFSAAIIKPLPTGGVAGITFTTDYSLTNSPQARLNPSYTPTLQFSFEQPLLQGFGVEINQLRGQHPGGILQGDQFATGPANGVEGILITRLRYDQSRAEFERNVNLLVLGVEVAYWNLYGAYWNLYSNEQALRQAFAARRIQADKYAAGSVNRADLAQTRGQYELFRGNRLSSLGGVLNAEKQLRGFLGLPMDDGCRLVPSDEPTLAPFQPDWCSAVNEALALRPELVMAREELKVTQMNLLLAKNLLLPDLRFTSTYGITAIGTHLDGPDNLNALRQLSSDHFNNWSAGLQLSMPIGFREAHAGLRVARLNLGRQYQVLRDQEYRAVIALTDSYQQIPQQYGLIETNRAQRIAFAEQLQVRSAEYVVGRGTLDILLEAQRFWAQALAGEYQAIVQYNIALANFEFTKGTLLHHDNVYIAEGPLPGRAQVRAVEHQRERTKALVLLEHALPVQHPPVTCDKDIVGPPEIPTDKAPSLPALLKDAPPLPKEAIAPPSLPERVGPEPAKGAASMIPGTPPGTSPAKGKPEWTGQEPAKGAALMSPEATGGKPGVPAARSPAMPDSRNPAGAPPILTGDVPRLLPPGPAVPAPSGSP